MEREAASQRCHLKSPLSKSFDFQFEIDMKIEKVVNFDFCINIEF